MKKLILATTAAFLAAAPAFGASVINKDGEARVIVVTENGSKSEISLAAGESMEFCGSGCFVTLPNGDREALTGSEKIEISGGKAVFR